MNKFVQLGEIASVVMGQAPPGKACNKEGNGYPFVKAGEFSTNYPIIREWTTNPLKKAQTGDVLVCVVGATAGKVNLGIDCAIGRSVAAVRPCQEALDTNYLNYFLQTKTASMRHGSQGLAQGVITRKMLLEINIPLPPLEEQRRIAAILGKASKLSGASQRRKDLLEACPLSIFIEIFGDPRYNPKQWPIIRLGDICINEDARRVPVKSADRKAMQGKYPYYGASGIIDHVDDYLFDGKRLLIGEDGANLLARSSPIAFIAEGKYWVNNHAHVLNENGKAKLRFLEYYFALIDLKPFVTGSAQPKLTRSALDSLPVPLPPMELQERFEAFLNVLDAKHAKAEISEQRISSIKRALQFFSFQGDGY